MKTAASWNQRLPLTRVRLMFAPAAMAGLLGPLPATPAQAKNELYAVTTASLSTKSATLAPIRGLSFRLPAASAQHDTAIVTLDMPNVNLTDFFRASTLSGQAAIVVDGVAVGTGQISYNVDNNNKVRATGNKPITVVVEVPLTTSTQTVEAEWSAGSGNVMHLFTFASLSADLLKTGGFQCAQTSQAQSTNSSNAPISGLSFTLPAATRQFDTAVLTLNLPNLYLTGPDSVLFCGSATMQINGTQVVGSGSIGNEDIGGDSGRKP